MEAAGGFAYEKGRTLEPLPNRWLGNVWRLQLTVLLAAGLPLTLVASSRLNRPAQLYAVGAWFILGLAFVAGMDIFRAGWPSEEDATARACAEAAHRRSG